MQINTVTRIVTLEEIRQAADRIRNIARRTPLADVSGAAGRPLYLKCENLQPAGAFKIRGAYNMVAQLTADQRAHGVITYSSGNHGQAMALAARELGAHAVVVMPTTAPKNKIEGAKGFGAEVILAGTTSADRRQRAEAEASARGLTMVPPFDHEWIIAGQGTCGLEILEHAASSGGNAGERVLGHEDGQARGVADDEVKMLEQRTTTRHNDAFIDDVTREFRRGRL